MQNRVVLKKYLETESKKRKKKIMKKIKAVIFDWAGTTVDYGCFAPVEAFIEAFKKYGITPTVEEVRKPMGMAKKDHVRTMLQMERISEAWEKVHNRVFTEDDVEEIYQESEKLILTILTDYSAPKPSVIESIAKLRERGIKIGSTTGYNDEMMGIVVPKAAEQGYRPDEWISPDATNKMGRPYPYMIFENMKRLGVLSVDNVIKVGDTIADIVEGKNAGVISVGIIEGSSLMALSEEEFNGLSEEEKEYARKKVKAIYLENGADYVIDNMSQLSELITTIETLTIGKVG